MQRFALSPLKGVFDASTAPSLRQVATNTFFPGTTNAAIFQINSSTPHYARDNITLLQHVFANAYGYLESNIGPATITTSVEYPIGTFTQFKYSAATIGNVTGGAIIISDALAIAIPKGALFNCRVFYQNPNGMIYYALPSADSSFLAEYAASGLSDKTLGGSIAANVNFLPPTALIAMTHNPAVGILGDSIPFGTYASPAGTGKDIGVFNAALGPSLAVMNLAASVDSAAGFLDVTKSGLRRQFLQYATGFVSLYGDNDIALNARTPAQVKTDLEAIAQLPGIVGKKLYASTLPPRTTGANFLTRGAQTPAATEAERIAANALIRAGLAGYTGIVDYADVFEGGRDLGTWTVDGSGNALPQDGTHPKLTGVVFGAAAGILTPAMFA
jgi:hypothetical protein